MASKHTTNSVFTKEKHRNKSEWKREKRKRSIIAGESYFSIKGKVVSKKEIGSDCKCKLRCYEKVDSNSRQMLFDGFYSLTSYDEQNAYLFGLIRKHDIKRKKNLLSDRRTCSYKYYVRIQGKEIQVCKLAFAHIHAITFRKIRTLSEKLDQNILFPRDCRGRHNNRPKKIPQETVNLIKSHIYEMIKSDDLKHFLKEDKNKEVMLEINVTKLYFNFLQKYEQNGVDCVTGQPFPDYTPQVKNWLYRKVFHEEVKLKGFNLLRKRFEYLCDQNKSQSHSVLSDKCFGSRGEKAAKISMKIGTGEQKVKTVDPQTDETKVNTHYECQQRPANTVTFVSLPFSAPSLNVPGPRSVFMEPKKYQNLLTNRDDLIGVDMQNNIAEQSVQPFNDFAPVHIPVQLTCLRDATAENRLPLLSEPSSSEPGVNTLPSSPHGSLSSFPSGTEDSTTLQRIRQPQQLSFYTDMSGFINTSQPINHADFQTVGEISTPEFY